MLLLPPIFIYVYFHQLDCNLTSCHYLGSYSYNFYSQSFSPVVTMIAEDYKLGIVLDNAGLLQYRVMDMFSAKIVRSGPLPITYLNNNRLFIISLETSQMQDCLGLDLLK